jgi:tRNA(fMet)-specific endonuclease VapC
MKYLLDTDTVSYLVRGNRNIANRIVQVGTQCAISAITVMELRSWKSHTKEILFLIESIIKDLPVISFDEEAATLSAEIRSSLRATGRGYSIPDLMIAGTAISNRLILVSNNTKDFEAIKNLEIESWVK